MLFSLLQNIIEMQILKHYESKMGIFSWDTYPYIMAAFQDSITKPI